VEFGEYALDTVHREFQEEIGQALTGVRRAGVPENIFQWGGATQHEIVFIFTAVFADEAAYEIPEWVIAVTSDRSSLCGAVPAASAAKRKNICQVSR